VIDDFAALGVLTTCEVVVEAEAASPQALGLVPFEALIQPFELAGVAGELTRFRTLLFAQPELRLLELLAEAGYDGRIVVFVPSVLDDDQRRAIERNVPAGLHVEACFAYEDPADLSVFGSAFVAVAFRGGSGVLVLHSWSARLLRRWHDLWYGARVFVDPLTSVVRSRLDGWESMTPDAQDTILGPQADLYPVEEVGS
jgi:hypothetical protein